MTEQEIDKIVGTMTVDQMIGQMFMGNVCGGESIDSAKRSFEEFHLGAMQFSGVFERFIRGGDYMPCGVCRNFPLVEVAAFIHEVKKVGREITGLPVIMAGDQEGSLSNSIFRRRNVAVMPAQMGFGAAGSVDKAYAAAAVSAREVKTLGLDMLYGPDLDVLSHAANPEIGSRSFSEDPAIVAEMGAAFVRGYAAHDVISNIKHFPGRGDGRSDAHKELESIDLSLVDFRRLAAAPFKAVLAAGADSVMMAHSLYPCLETERIPASLSRRIITGFLREELGFIGLVIPDDLSMFAISKNFGIPRASAMCLEAGADMVFMKVIEEYRPAIAAIKESLSAGRLTEEQLAQSVKRILRLKAKRNLFTHARFEPELVRKIVGSKAHAGVAQRAADDAIIVLKNNDAVLPLSRSGGRLLVIQPRDMHVVLSNDETLNHEMLARELGRHFPDVESMIIDEMPTRYQHYEAVGRAKNAAAVVFGIYAAGLSDEARALLDELIAPDRPIVMVNTNSPWAFTRVPAGVAAFVSTFGLTAFAFNATARLIAGKLTPTATLPVTLDQAHPRGFAVALKKRIRPETIPS
jgi:beta-N-acetylhexosaminidase